MKFSKEQEPGTKKLKSKIKDFSPQPLKGFSKFNNSLEKRRKGVGGERKKEEDGEMRKGKKRRGNSDVVLRRQCKHF